MVTIIYPYRNRDLKRIKRSLESLNSQTNMDFKVLLIDYGSDLNLKESVRALVESYSFCDYLYSFHVYQPWSRAKAINIGIRRVDTAFVFIADIDIIFKSDFIQKLEPLKIVNRATYFKVGFLSEQESALNKTFEDYKISSVSVAGAAGLSLFPTEQLKAIGGFDEFFHFWGAEDENIHGRFMNAGFKSVFYSDEIFLLHQWHPTYRSSDRNDTQNLRISNITRINMFYNNAWFTSKEVYANKSIRNWGYCLTEANFNTLQSPAVFLEFDMLQETTSTMINLLMECYKNKVVQVTMMAPSLAFKMKQRIKKVLGKDYIQVSSLIQTNDALLLDIIKNRKTVNYMYKIEDKNTIVLTVEL